MYCATADSRRRAFTLLEVMLAVIVLALITLTLYRFVDTALTTIRLSTEYTARKSAMQNLVAVLESEFTNLPPTQPGALIGQAHMFSDKSSDEVTWLTNAGNGLFAMDADGLWKVSLELRPQEKSASFTLGLVRELPDNKDTRAEHWLPLMRDVDALEVRYFDHRLNVWLEKWSDQMVRPNLVRIRIWRMNETDPYETVIELPPTKPPVAG